MPAEQATSRRVDRSGSKDGQTTFADPMGPEPMFPSTSAASFKPAANDCAVPLRPVRIAPPGHPSDGRPLDVCETHTPWTLGQWSLRIELCPQASQRSATATCNAGEQSTILHKTGMVSRVPCGPCRAAARRADRNTYQTSPHHAYTRAFTDTEARQTDR